MSLTFQQIEESKIKTKFFSPSENKIFTKTELIKMIQWDWNRISDEDNYNEFLLQHQIPCDLEELKRIRFYRDEQIHNFDCEFATGRSCNCWCGEKYHGLMGVGAKVITTENMEGNPQ